VSLQSTPPVYTSLLDASSRLAVDQGITRRFEDSISSTGISIACDYKGASMMNECRRKAKPCHVEHYKEAIMHSLRVADVI
jgi:hypothetical protein